MKRYRVGEFVEPPIEEHDGEWIRYSDHVNALATIREEARRAAFKEAREVLGITSTRSEKYPNRYISASAFKVRADCALEAAERGERDG